MQSNIRNDGRAFEKLIEGVCVQYQSRGLLRVKKVDPPTRVFGGRVIFTKNPWLDYVGTWTERGGRMVTFECKSTAEDSLEIGGTRGLTARQIDELRLWEGAGAVCFVLWHLRQEVGMLNPEGVAAVLSRRRHLKFTDCWRVPRGEGYVIHDFLTLMRTKF